MYDITEKIRDTAQRLNAVERLREFRSANSISSREIIPNDEEDVNRLSIDIDADDSSDFIKSKKSLQNTVDFYKEYVQYLGTLRASDAEIQKKAVALKRQYNSAMTVDEVKSQLADENKLLKFELIIKQR